MFEEWRVQVHMYKIKDYTVKADLTGLKELILMGFNQACMTRIIPYLNRKSGISYIKSQEDGKGLYICINVNREHSSFVFSKWMRR